MDIQKKDIKEIINKRRTTHLRNLLSNPGVVHHYKEFHYYGTSVP